MASPLLPKPSLSIAERNARRLRERTIFILGVLAFYTLLSGEQQLASLLTDYLPTWPSSAKCQPARLPFFPALQLIVFRYYFVYQGARHFSEMRWPELQADGTVAAKPPMRAQAGRRYMAMLLLCAYVLFGRGIDVLGYCISAWVRWAFEFEMPGSLAETLWYTVLLGVAWGGAVVAAWTLTRPGVAKAGNGTEDGEEKMDGRID